MRRPQGVRAALFERVYWGLTQLESVVIRPPISPECRAGRGAESDEKVPAPIRPVALAPALGRQFRFRGTRIAVRTGRLKDSLDQQARASAGDAATSFDARTVARNE